MLLCLASLTVQQVSCVVGVDSKISVLYFTEVKVSRLYSALENVSWHSKSKLLRCFSWETDILIKDDSKSSVRCAGTISKVVGQNA
jgi:hypothetical protein